MRWRIGTIVFGMILVALAIGSPASGHHTCNHNCGLQLDACVNACGSDQGCANECWLTWEHCNFYYCNGIR